MDTQQLRLETNFKISDLVNEISNGELRLPRFQRDYVWDRKKIVKLFDSIYREYPIGSLFFWDADEKYRSLYKNLAELELPQPRSDRPLRYILDGQQRATSIYVAIMGLTVNNVDYGRICFDLETEEFIDRPPNNHNLIALKDIVDRTKSLRLVTQLSPAYQQTFLRCASVFQNYPLSVITVRDMNLGDAIEIFQRINRGAKRLTIFDLVVAKTWSPEFDLKERYETLKKEVESSGFGNINPEIVTHAASLIINKFCTMSNQLSISEEQFRTIWPELEIAIKQAIEYLRNNLGVRIIDFVPYPSMIALLAYLFYNVPGRSLNSEMADVVREWFWKSALNERYTTSLEQKMGEDRREVFDTLLKGERPTLGVVSLSPERLAGITISLRSAIRNAFLCMLALRHPRHFKTGSLISLDNVLAENFNSPEKHHIFPRAYLRKQGISAENLLANFCFIPAELNKDISNKKPSDYFSAYARQNSDFEETLFSHLLTYSDAIKTNNYQAFLAGRTAAIFAEFEKLAGSKFLQGMDGNANKALDQIEIKIRRLIIAQLSERWEKSISKKLQIKMDESLAAVAKRLQVTNPHITNMERLEQLNIRDYRSIIEANWSYFADVFGDINDMKARFESLRKYRNDIRHVKEMDSVTQKEGEAAIVWLNRCID